MASPARGRAIGGNYSGVVHRRATANGRPTGFRLISAPFPDAPKRAESEPGCMY